MTYDLERVLADIDADHGDRCVEHLRHGVLLVLSAPCQLLVLARPEHGRTIPLTALLKTGSVCGIVPCRAAPVVGRDLASSASLLMRTRWGRSRYQASCRKRIPRKFTVSAKRWLAFVFNAARNKGSLVPQPCSCRASYGGGNCVGTACFLRVLSVR